MPRFVTIGYGDQAGYERTPQAVLAAAHARDAELQRSGAVMGITCAPVQVRNTERFEPAPSPARSCVPRCRGRLRGDRGRHDRGRRGDGVGLAVAVAHGVIEVWPLQ